MLVMPVTTTVYQIPQQDAANAPAVAAATPPSTSVVLEISDEARARIDALKAGATAMEQAVKENRQQARKASLDRVAMAHDYLRMLLLMSSPDDPAAAREAVRVAREISSAAVPSSQSVTKEDKDAARSDTAALASAAGNVRAISRGIVQRYLQHRKHKTEGDRKLFDEVNGAGMGLTAW
jgi:hypothetical protein